MILKIMTQHSYFYLKLKYSCKCSVDYFDNFQKMEACHSFYVAVVLISTKYFTGRNSMINQGY